MKRGAEILKIKIMMMPPKSITIISMLLMGTCFIKEIYGLMCYQCNSLFDPTCATLRENNTDSLHYKPCEIKDRQFDEPPFCMKIYQKIRVRDDLVRIVRQCGFETGYEKDCYRIRNPDHEELVCRCFKDACNSAITRLPHYHHRFLVFSISILFLFIKFLI